MSRGEAGKEVLGALVDETPAQMGQGDDGVLAVHAGNRSVVEVAGRLGAVVRGGHLPGAGHANDRETGVNGGAPTRPSISPSGRGVTGWETA